MEKYTMFMNRKNQYSENENTTQSNLQIQCNPYQATNGIFHRARTNNFTICMEIQKILKQPKQSCERRMKLEESTCLTSGSMTKPQSSRQYGIGTKTEIQINGNKRMEINGSKKPKDKSMNLWTPYLRQRRQEYTMEKRQSL